MDCAVSARISCAERNRDRSGGTGGVQLCARGIPGDGGRYHRAMVSRSVPNLRARVEFASLLYDSEAKSGDGIATRTDQGRPGPHGDRSYRVAARSVLRSWSVGAARNRHINSKRGGYTANGARYDG